MKSKPGAVIGPDKSGATDRSEVDEFKPSIRQMAIQAMKVYLVTSLLVGPPDLSGPMTAPGFDFIRATQL